MKTVRLIAAGAAVTLLTGIGLQAQGTRSVTTWTGVYTKAQAAEGQGSYTRNCAGCHLDDLSGSGPAPAIGGDAFRVQNEKRTVADLMSRIKTTMPPDRPGQLTDTTYINLVAYLLQQAGYPEGPQALPATPELLRAIRITPKRDGQK
jgi:mono/diheme cytochrome c family protein